MNHCYQINIIPQGVIELMKASYSIHEQKIDLRSIAINLKRSPAVSTAGFLFMVLKDIKLK
jgi:hypothetical protein